MTKNLRLGINIDHVATLRNARGGENPCPVRAAELCKEAGADGITAHLREDRRHIRDRDIERLKNEIALPLNLEMAMTDEMLSIALKTMPHAVCLVPEKREELTTEGGLDAARYEKQIAPFVQKLQDAGIRVSLFIAPSHEQIHAAQRIGARAIEIHTGAYCHLLGAAREKERHAISEAAILAHGLGLEVHAGHGLNYNNVGAIAAIPEIIELNIGHFIIGEAVFVGIKEAIVAMRRIIHESRATSHESR
ncbi:MAG: pyridoxine 5'-phosphate synthase [Pseudomonadota bacterium]|nr:pyridoxine 5'-phosphate synthase [Pseudomonadota bacterium]MDE3037050.1 pyridoxine 5'-phosphate synthase [Pseudomonadota bacterium]